MTNFNITVFESESKIGLQQDECFKYIFVFHIQNYFDGENMTNLCTYTLLNV